MLVWGVFCAGSSGFRGAAVESNLKLSVPVLCDHFFCQGEVYTSLVVMVVVGVSAI